MTAGELDRIVERACAQIPARFRRRLRNVVFVVEPEPSDAQLASLRVGRGGTLLGLYEGRPLTSRSVSDPFAMPDRITIFQGPHERAAGNLAHLEQLVAGTIWHEVAHYFGMDERQVRTAERARAGRNRK